MGNKLSHFRHISWMRRNGWIFLLKWGPFVECTIVHVCINYRNRDVLCRALDVHWMTGDVRDLGLIQSWKLGSFSHIGSNFVSKWGFSGAADTNQALSRHPFDHALDSPFLPETLLLVLSTELQFCLRSLNARLHCKVWWSLRLLVSCFLPPECESCVYRLQQPCLLFLVIPPFTGRRIGTYGHGIQNQDLHEEIVILSFSNQALNQGKASHDISKYLSQKYQLFHQ